MDFPITSVYFHGISLVKPRFFHPLHLCPSGHGAAVAAVGRWRVTSRGKSTGDVRDMEGVEVEKHGHIIWVYGFHN